MISFSYRKTLYLQIVFTLVLTSVCTYLFYLQGMRQMQNLIYSNIKAHISDMVYSAHKSLSMDDTDSIAPYLNFKQLQMKGIKSITLLQDKTIIASTSKEMRYQSLNLTENESDASSLIKEGLFVTRFLTGGVKYTLAVQITKEATEDALKTFVRDVSILTFSILFIVIAIQFLIYYLLYYISFTGFLNDIKNRRFDIKYPINELTGLSRMIRGLVTSLNRTTEETENQKDLFRTLFYNLPIASFYKDKEGRYLGGNEEFCRMIGVDEKDILGKTAYDVVDTETAEILEARDRDVFDNPEGMQVYEEDIFIKKLNKTRSVIYYKSALKDRGGNPTGTVAALMDITQKKRQERLNRLRISTANAFLLSDENEIFQKLSTAMINEFGCRGAYATYIDADGREINPSGISTDTANSVTAGIVDGMDIIGHLTLFDKDSGFTFEDKEDAHHIASLLSSTLKHWYKNRYHEQNLVREKKTLELIVQKEMEHKKKQEQIIFEQKKFADMGLMISAVAHHWRQPINALGIMVQTLRDTYDDNELDEKEIAFFETNAMRLIKYLSETIDNFSDFFASDKDKIRFNAPDELFNLISLLNIQIKNKDIAIEAFCSCKDEPMDCFDLADYHGCEQHGADVFGLLGEFKQSIINILYNAVDAVQEAQKAGRITKGMITVSTQVMPNELKISIGDNGGGIPDDIIFMIFDPYFSTKEEGKGTGLGLYMSRLMIENNMGGRITAENRSGGAVFTITLPLN